MRKSVRFLPAHKRPRWLEKTKTVKKITQELGVHPHPSQSDLLENAGNLFEGKTGPKQVTPPMQL